MFKSSIFAVAFSALVLPVAGAAFAGQGADQMAKQLGLPTGVYSVAQMIQLQDARRDGDKAAEAFILQKGNEGMSGGTASSGTSISGGAAQLARQVGVAPGAYSVNEMIRLSDALKEGDRQTVAFILGGSDNGNTKGDIGVVTPAKAQLAAFLNLDPTAFSTEDLMVKYLDNVN